jgi:hypothetical protein
VEETKVHREYHGLVQVRHATGGNQSTQRIPVLDTTLGDKVGQLGLLKVPFLLIIH